MAANNIVLDVDVLVDLLAGRPPGQAVAEKALEKALALGCRVWLVASSIPGLLDALEKSFVEAGANAGRGGRQEAASLRARDALRGFLKKAAVLSSYGFDAEGALESNRPEGALTLRAADALGGDVSILTRDPELIRADHRVMDPETFVRRDGEAPAAEKAIPFVDLACQQQRILPQLEKGLAAVLRHGQYIMGPEIVQLEQRLAAYAGVEHAICCASGTDALLLALMAYGVGPGDAIFTAPFTFIATAEVVSLLGATPVFVDIDPSTFNIDPGCLERAIEACRKNNTRIHPLPALPQPTATVLEPKGIIAVDLFGLPADYDRINAIAARDGLFVIEDAAQSFGAAYHGKKACSLADIGCTSFFPAKPLGCYGDGGAVFTKDDALSEKLDSLRIHGKGKDKYENARIGLNARMDTLQAALLLPKLEILPEELLARNRVASRYTELLSPHEVLQTPFLPAGRSSAWAQYSILSDRRQHIQSALKAKGIPTAVYYPKPLHLQTAYAGLGYREGDFPEAESASCRILSLPMHPYLAPGQIERIAENIARAVHDDGR